HVTVNDSLQQLDALCMASVRASDVTQPPADREDGDAWLVAAEPQGEWTIAQAHDLAVFADSGWRFFTPMPGWRVWDEAAAKLRIYDGSDWAPLSAGSSTPSAFQNLSLVGVGTTATPSNPLAVELNAAVFNAQPSSAGGTDDLRITYNKPGVSNTASFMFQSGWSGRGEVGLTGDDRLSIKVSADGRSWREGWVLDGANETAETALQIIPQQANAQDIGSGGKPFRSLYLTFDPMISSDVRSKHSVSSLTQATELLSALRPIQYVHDGEADIRFGFLAQDVRSALHACGFSETATWRLSDPGDPNSAQMIAPTQLIAVLVSGFNALRDRIEKIEAILAPRPKE
ncbi:MAG: DUF2793 domain-containing protein, partial [Pseudomonadota bacterium]